MAKVHPNSVAIAPQPAAAATAKSTMEVLTVWRKSLLFNCDGFTVFDAKGDLAFRVDCYDGSSRSRHRRRAEVVLMDVAGKPLLTLRRHRTLFSEHWLVFDGDADAADGSNNTTRPLPLLSVCRHVSRRRAASSTNKAPLAHVVSSSSSSSGEAAASYVVEGSYGRRACAVRDAISGDVVAEVRRKESVGDDVFRLVADPRLGAPLAMGLVIALDEMFGSRSRVSSARSLLRRTLSA